MITITNTTVSWLNDTLNPINTAANFEGVRELLITGCNTVCITGTVDCENLDLTVGNHSIRVSPIFTITSLNTGTSNIYYSGFTNGVGTTTLNLTQTNNNYDDYNVTFEVIDATTFIVCIEFTNITDYEGLNLGDAFVNNVDKFHLNTASSTNFLDNSLPSYYNQIKYLQTFISIRPNSATPITDCNVNALTPITANWYSPVVTGLQTPPFSNQGFQTEYNGENTGNKLSLCGPTKINNTVGVDGLNFTDVYAWFICVSDNNNSVGFIDNYKGSLIDLNSGNLLKGSNSPINNIQSIVNDNGAYVVCFDIDNTLLVDGNSYCVILQYYDKVNNKSFAVKSEKLTTNLTPLCCPLDYTATFEDYKNQFDGTCIMQFVEGERIKGKVCFSQPENYVECLEQTKCITNGGAFTDYINKAVITFYDGNLDTPIGTKTFINFDGQGFPTNSLGSGLEFVNFTNSLQIDGLCFDYEMRLPSDWVGKNIIVCVELCLDYTGPIHTDKQQVCQIFNVKAVNADNDIINPVIEYCKADGTVIQSTICITDANCIKDDNQFCVKATIEVANPTEYCLIPLLDVGPIEGTQLENNTFTGNLQQLNGFSVISQDVEFNADGTAKICFNTNMFEPFSKNKITFIAKKKDCIIDGCSCQLPTLLDCIVDGNDNVVFSFEDDFNACVEVREVETIESCEPFFLEFNAYQTSLPDDPSFLALQVVNCEDLDFMISILDNIDYLNAIKNNDCIVLQAEGSLATYVVGKDGSTVTLKFIVDDTGSSGFNGNYYAAVYIVNGDNTETLAYLWTDTTGSSNLVDINLECCEYEVINSLTEWQPVFSGETATIIIDGLEKGKDYEFRIKNKCECNESDWQYFIESIPACDLEVVGEKIDFTCAAKGQIKLIQINSSATIDNVVVQGPNGYINVTGPNPTLPLLFDNLEEGDYIITVLDSAGCEVIQNYTIINSICPDTCNYEVNEVTDFLNWDYLTNNNVSAYNFFETFITVTDNGNSCTFTFDYSFNFNGSFASDIVETLNCEGFIYLQVIAGNNTFIEYLAFNSSQMSNLVIGSKTITFDVAKENVNTCCNTINQFILFTNNYITDNVLNSTEQIFVRYNCLPVPACQDCLDINCQVTNINCNDNGFININVSGFIDLPLIEVFDNNDVLIGGVVGSSYSSQIQNEGNYKVCITNANNGCKSIKYINVGFDLPNFELITECVNGRYRFLVTGDLDQIATGLIQWDRDNNGSFFTHSIFDSNTNTFPTTLRTPICRRSNFRVFRRFIGGQLFNCVRFYSTAAYNSVEWWDGTNWITTANGLDDCSNLQNQPFIRFYRVNYGGSICYYLINGTNYLNYQVSEGNYNSNTGVWTFNMLILQRLNGVYITNLNCRKCKLIPVTATLTFNDCPDIVIEKTLASHKCVDQCQHEFLEGIVNEYEIN